MIVNEEHEEQIALWESYEGLILPPPGLRKGPPAHCENAPYLTSAMDLANSIRSIIALCNAEQLAIPEDLAGTSILDLGSGPMRLLTGLDAAGLAYGGYVGVDVQQPPIDWANRHLKRPNARFYHIDFKNDRYNPEGSITESFRLPEPEASFDLIVMRSLFTHMRLANIGLYLAEARRLVKPGGAIYLSAFVAMTELAEEENPPGFLGKHRRPLHRVRLNRHHFEQLAHDKGLAVSIFCDNILGQPTYLLVPLPES